MEIEATISGGGSKKKKRRRHRTIFSQEQICKFIFKLIKNFSGNCTIKLKIFLKFYNCFQKKVFSI
jgi:hypothetical protein